VAEGALSAAARCDRLGRARAISRLWAHIDFVGSTRVILQRRQDSEIVATIDTVSFGRLR